jgi:hypothetical protein
MCIVCEMHCEHIRHESHHPVATVMLWRSVRPALLLCSATVVLRHANLQVPNWAAELLSQC